MFQRARYQKGMIDRVKRKQGPDCWIFRWRESDANGKRVRRKVVLGTVKDLPTESSALKAAESYASILMKSSRSHPSSRFRSELS